MTKHPAANSGDLPEGNEYGLEDDEADISGLLKGLPAFPGGQYFNEIMVEKMRHQKVAKFKLSRKLASDF
jgi:hypothetical protein